MNNTTNSRNNYSIYCREHITEFADELKGDASRALSSWFGRIVAALLAISSILNYIDASTRENSFSNYMFLAYAIPILILVLYPVITLAFSTIEKYSPLVLDFLCLISLLGFCLTLRIQLLGARTPEELQTLSVSMLGQINFVLMLGTAFSYHATYWVTLTRNIIFTLIVSAVLYFIGIEASNLNQILILQGILGGTMVSWIFFDSIRTRFYLKSTDADTRQHLYNQLSKLVYPHQLERIKVGDELENTMPLKEGKAIINVFDVQRSSEIRHEKTQDFFMGVFQAFLEVCMKGYEHNPLRSRAFRLKETGDGFISAVGYPFLPIDSRSLADSAVSTALAMFEAFNLEVKKFNYLRPIKGAMGLAYNSVQGTFQSGGIRSYDLFGDALIQAAKYEELRKQPILWNIFTDYANKLGFDDFHILIVQELVYNSLSPSYREMFIEIDLSEKQFVENNIQMMYDSEAKYVYFHILQ